MLTAAPILNDVPYYFAVTTYEVNIEDYVWPYDFHLWRVIFNDYTGGSISAPAEGTIVRFNSTKPNTVDDIRFSGTVL